MEEQDDGQVLPLVALVMVAAALAVIALGRLAGETATRARATAAADAAALAGAVDGEDGARRLAHANGASLATFERLGASDVRVRVDHAGVIASARARRYSAADPGSGRGRDALAPALRAALARAEQLLGRRVPITSGSRSGGEQLRLWRDRASNPYPVAPPGTSAHERGMAIDVPATFAADLARVGPQAGLCRPLPESDPVHFELCPRFTLSSGG